MVKNTDLWAIVSPDYQAADFVAGVEVRNPSGLNGTYGILFGLGGGLALFLHFRDRSRGLLWYLALQFCTNSFKYQEGIYRDTPFTILITTLSARSH